MKLKLIALGLGLTAALTLTALGALKLAEQTLREKVIRV